MEIDSLILSLSLRIMAETVTSSSEVDDRFFSKVVLLIICDFFLPGLEDLHTAVCLPPFFESLTIQEETLWVFHSSLLPS